MISSRTSNRSVSRLRSAIVIITSRVVEERVEVPRNALAIRSQGQRAGMGRRVQLGGL
jgi:hypothetical protein